jgi:hypothetical protein
MIRRLSEIDYALVDGSSVDGDTVATKRGRWRVSEGDLWSMDQVESCGWEASTLVSPPSWSGVSRCSICRRRRRAL